MKFKKSLALLALSQLPIFSATFNVSTTLELRQALEKVALMDENSTIILNENIYSTNDDNIGTFTYKSEKNDKVLTIECKSENKNKCILDGNNKNRVLYFGGNIEVVLKNLTIRNGNVTAKYGGGVFKDGYGKLSAINVDFINNYLNGTDNEARGGAIYASSVYIDGCNFENNTAYKDNGGSGGAIYANYGIIKNSIFKNNVSKGIYAGSGFGGAIYVRGYPIVIVNNKFYNNIAKCNFNLYNRYSKCGTGGAIYTDINNNYGQTSITNSLIANNFFIDNESKNPGSAVVANYVPLINNTIINNKGGESIVAKETKLVNNLFLNNSKDLLVEDDYDNNIYLYNNIIDMSKINGIENIYKLNNIQSSQEVLLNNELYTLKSNSLGIDSGLNPTDETFINLFDKDTYKTILEYLKTDYFGNERIIDGKIDIGASEYDPKNAINENAPKLSIVLSGDQKVYYPITINFNIETPNTISELYIDKGNGYESVATTLRSFTVTYNSAGEHTVKVKAVDDQGNVAEVAKSINVYNLTTQEAIEYGKKLCQEDPASCGIETSSTATEVKDMIFETPKDQIRNVLTLQSTYNVAGYFIHYSDPNSKNPAFDWIFITPSMAAFKLQGMKSDGSFSWSENLADQFSGIKLSNDGKFITFEK